MSNEIFFQLTELLLSSVRDATQNNSLYLFVLNS